MRLGIDRIIEYLNTIPYKTVFRGCAYNEIDGFCSLNNLKDNCILWVKHPDNVLLSNFDGISKALIVSSRELPINNKNVSYIITEQPKAVFFSILHEFYAPKKTIGIAKSSIVKTNSIGENVLIGELSFIDSSVTIGEGSIVENNVTIQGKVSIGKNCIIHSGVVIGNDGYGLFLSEEEIPQKVEHFGGVTIEDNVEIGANTCIERGTIDDTHIGANTKIGILCHIAHNVQIGESCMVVAENLICGSAKVSNNCYIAPGAIVENQKTVGRRSFVGMGAVVLEDVPDNMVVVGVPAKVIRKRRKNDI